MVSTLKKTISLTFALGLFSSIASAQNMVSIHGPTGSPEYKEKVDAAGARRPGCEKLADDPGTVFIKTDRGRKAFITRCMWSDLAIPTPAPAPTPSP